jgi:hypothetical protein
MGSRHGMAVRDRAAPRTPTSAPGERRREWPRQISRSDTVPSFGSIERSLERQVEHLSDAIAEARHAGLSWATIGAIVGVPAAVVRTIHDE